MTDTKLLILRRSISSQPTKQTFIKETLILFGFYSQSSSSSQRKRWMITLQLWPESLTKYTHYTSYSTHEKQSLNKAWTLTDLIGADHMDSGVCLPCLSKLPWPNRYKYKNPLLGMLIFLTYVLHPVSLGILNLFSSSICKANHRFLFMCSF